MTWGTFLLFFNEGLTISLNMHSKYTCKAVNTVNKFKTVISFTALLCYSDLVFVLYSILQCLLYNLILENNTRRAAGASHKKQARGHQKFFW